MPRLKRRRALVMILARNLMKIRVIAVYSVLVAVVVVVDVVVLVFMQVVLMLVVVVAVLASVANVEVFASDEETFCYLQRLGVENFS